jgi:gas vesicle protein
MTDRGKRAIFGEKDHTLRNLVSFAAGLGLGVGVGILFAPASGEETRNSMREKVQDIGDRVRERFSSDETIATGGQEHPEP